MASLPLYCGGINGLPGCECYPRTWLSRPSYQAIIPVNGNLEARALVVFSARHGISDTGGRKLAFWEFLVGNSSPMEVERNENAW